MHRPLGVRVRFVSWAGSAFYSIGLERGTREAVVSLSDLYWALLSEMGTGTDCIGDAGGCGNREAENGGCAENASA